MNDSDTPSDEGRKPASPVRRRRAAPSRRRAPARPRKTAAKTASKGAPARRQTASRRPAATPAAVALLLDSLASRAKGAGGKLAAMSEEGADAARRAGSAFSAASRRTIDGLAREWRRMDAKRKAQFLSALLGALAAASAPLVRSRLKKKVAVSPVFSPSRRRQPSPCR